MTIIHPDHKVLIEWELITNDHKINLHESKSQTLRKFVIEELCKRFEGFSVIELGDDNGNIRLKMPRYGLLECGNHWEFAAWSILKELADDNEELYNLIVTIPLPQTKPA